MNLRDLARHAATIQRVAKTAPRDLRNAADLIETGTDLVAQFADSPLAAMVGLTRPAKAAPRPAAKPQRPPPVRAPSTPSFRTADERPAPPIRVAPAEVIVATIDDDLDATVIDPRRPAPKRSSARR